MSIRKKKLILGMPRTFSTYKVIIDRLEQLGYEVIDISYDNDVFKYKNLWDRFINLVRKIFLNDKGYKSKLRFESLGSSILNKLKHIDGKADYCLLIRADIYPRNVIKEILLKSNKTIAYQWDGVDRFPAIKDLIDLFDRFYIFDKKDANLIQGNYLETTNFYFNHLDDKKVSPKINTFFFVGSFIKCRWDEIQATSNLILQNLGIPKFILYTNDNTAINNNSFEGISFITTPISYEDTIKLTLEHHILVDFLTKVHAGLSFRVFEAIGYRRKLITNNSDVKSYDFYHPDNIYILGEENRTISDFIKSPYFDIDEEIISKYSFDNWIKNILEN